MAEKVVSVRVAAKVDGAVAGLRKVKSSVDDLTKAPIEKPAKAFESLSNKAAIAGGVVALGLGKAVASFADFDQAMSAASAALPDAGAKMDDLRKLAIKMGADTVFSATESAQGITEMAKAGVSAGDILNGGLNGALSLAAAGQLDVGRASEIAATALNQFNLKGKDVAHVADLYAAAAGKAQGSVEDIAQAMKYAGVTASSMGVSIEETTGVMGLFASKGIIGEQAGTTFRSMLMSLTAPSKIAAGAMQDLGINVYDTSGKFIGMKGVASELQQRLAGLDEATRNQALGQIFGNEALSGAIALYQAGADGVDQWTKSVNDAGFAQKQASKLMDNLKGDVEQLSGSLETVFIQSGSGANGALRTLTQTATGLVNVIGNVPGPLLLAGTAFTSLALLLPKGMLAFKKYRTELDTLGISMDRLSAKAPRLAKAVSNVGKAASTLAIAATAVYAFGDAVDSLNADKLGADLTHTSDGLALINRELAASTSNGWGRVSSDLDTFGKVLGATFDPGVANEIDNVIGGFKSVFGGENVSNIANAAKQFDAIDQALAGLVGSGNASQAEQTFAQMTKVAQEQGISVEQLQQKLPLYAAAVAKAGTEAQGAATGTGVMTTATDDLKQAADDAQAALDALQKEILGMGDPIAQQMQAESDYQAAIDDAAAAVDEYRKAQVKRYIDDGKSEATAKRLAEADIKAGKALDVHTEAGRKTDAALRNLRGSILSKVAADVAVSGSADEAAAATQRGRDEFVKAAVAAGKTKTQAEELADQLGLIPNDVRIKVAQSGAAAAGAQIDAAAVDRTATIYVKTAGALAAAAQAARIRQEYASIRAGMATGGAVYGPGTATSDSIPAMLSAGEHVWTASEVSKLGGQSAMYALRSAVRSGWVPKFAGGGAVEARYVSAPVSVSSSTSIDYNKLAAAVRGGDTFYAYGLDVEAAIDQAVRKRDWKLRG